MKQYVKRLAVMSMLAMGVISAQANAASVAVNLSSAGVSLIVQDDCKHERKHHHKAEKMGMKKHDKHELRHRHAMARHKVDMRRIEERGKKVAKGKR